MMSPQQVKRTPLKGAVRASSKKKKAPRTSRRPDLRAWLRANGYGSVAKDIETLVERWQAAGKRTRRNWWDVLGGDRKGNPRTVDGICFPVITDTKGPNAANIAKPSQKSIPVETLPRDRGAPSKTVARPFLKWAGGKRQLLPHILARLPQTSGVYHEPFIGGGAVFFALRPSRAMLSDTNERLVRAYRGIKTSADAVMKLLDSWRHDKKTFLKLREWEVDQASDVEVAAWLIYLNKTGFNGLYRVNSKNKFNVPFGKNQNAQLYDPDNLRACADALSRASINCEDFSAVSERVKSGDVVYLDPPYIPMSDTSYFTSYTASGFSMADHVRLRDLAVQLRNRGAFVLLSNSSSRHVYELYESSFTCTPVAATRLLNSDTRGRGPVIELLIG